MEDSCTDLRYPVRSRYANDEIGSGEGGNCSCIKFIMGFVALLVVAASGCRREHDEIQDGQPSSSDAGFVRRRLRRP